MRRFKRILVVPVTAGSAPPAALTEAVVLAEASGAEVRVLGHLDPLSAVEQHAADVAGVGDLVDRVASAVDARLGEWTAAFDRNVVSVDVAVGSLPAVVADAVETDGHDLVIVAADRSPESAAASRRIVRAAPCPVWLLRPGFRGACVLAALDLEADAERNRLILDLARSQAESHGGRLRVMYAWQVTHLEELSRSGGPALDPAVQAAMAASVEAAHRESLDQLLGPDVDRRDVHLVDGSPGRSVLALVDLYRADLVVMGAGEARAGSAELGSTAEQVLADGESSVLVVRGTGPVKTDV
ncbi:MAG: universal stress protein [Acidimicrobiales bacterium]